MKKFFIEPRDLGNGKEYSVYSGSEEDHARGMSDWHDTFAKKKHAKEYIKEHEASHWAGDDGKPNK